MMTAAGWRRIVSGTALAMGTLLLAGSPLWAEDEQCGSCERTVMLSGDFKHVHKSGSVSLVGTTDYRMFAEEIDGDAFALSVPGLPAGQYVAEFAFAETHLTNAGQRSFDIRCGDQWVAQNLDVWRAAGGLGHPYRLRYRAEHAGEALAGPLTFNFIARNHKAMFNGFKLTTAAGQPVIETMAADLVPAMEDWARAIPAVAGPVIFTNADLPIEPRVRDLIARLSLAEKVSQLNNAAQPIRRLNVPAYNYWDECLHGVARAGVATVFPQAIGMAASWDDRLLGQVADVISTEARAKHNAEVRRNAFGDCPQYFGLTFWTPNINLFRDPRWGRGQETYGEDPFLTARLGVSLICGLQGNDPKYLKTAACAKHFAVHSGPEPLRSSFDAEPPEWDLYDSYLPQFEAAVREAHVETVMGAYNRLFGEPCCSNPLLLQKLLRERWGFQGHVVSDCSAITFIYTRHKVVATPEAAAARAAAAGCDLCCGRDYYALAKAVNEKLITPEQIDTALQHVFTTRFRLGLFDPPARVPYAAIPEFENDTPAHGALALKMARESLVLLKNNGTLPLDRRRLKRLAVIGANAKSVNLLLGNYNGTPSHPVTIWQGITNLAGPGVAVSFDPGVPLALEPGEAPPDFASALAVARDADAVIYVGGIDAGLEGEEHPVNFAGFDGGDRVTIELPAVQEALLAALKTTGRPIVLVNCSGSAMAMPWEDQNLAAILQAWYPGQAGGQAVAEVLFGDRNPGGKLPVTFYRATADLPPFEDYSLSNRTYRYFGGQPLYAFGHGLSYTSFALREVKFSGDLTGTSGRARVDFQLVNTGQRAGDEVVQIYLRETQPRAHQPREQLCGFRRFSLEAGDRIKARIEIPVQQFRHWDAAKSDYVVAPGEYDLLAGTASDEILARGRVRIR